MANCQTQNTHYHTHIHARALAHRIQDDLGHAARRLMQRAKVVTLRLTTRCFAHKILLSKGTGVRYRHPRRCATSLRPLTSYCGR